MSHGCEVGAIFNKHTGGDMGINSEMSAAKDSCEVARIFKKYRQRARSSFAETFILHPKTPDWVLLAIISDDNFGNAWWVKHAECELEMRGVKT